MKKETITLDAKKRWDAATVRHKWLTEKPKRIIVLGGSFNPPTVAHHRLMQTALDALGAEIGFYVPVSDAYLKRKMRHSGISYVNNNLPENNID
jgi:ATP sulfurylase